MARPDRVVGVWMLRSCYVENTRTGERTEYFGSDPSGVLMLHPDGRMAAIMTRRDRSEPVTEADRAAALQTILAYSGRYRLEPPDRFVTSVDVAWLPSWIGTDQARTYVLDGNTLQIFSGPMRMPPPNEDDEVIAVMFWEREAPSR